MLCHAGLPFTTTIAINGSQYNSNERIRIIFGRRKARLGDGLESTSGAAIANAWAGAVYHPKTKSRWIHERQRAHNQKSESADTTRGGAKPILKEAVLPRLRGARPTALMCALIGRPLIPLNRVFLGRIQLLVKPPGGLGHSQCRSRSWRRRDDGENRFSRRLVSATHNDSG
jgi:hypothetical protein